MCRAPSRDMLRQRYRLLSFIQTAQSLQAYELGERSEVTLEVEVLLA